MKNESLLIEFNSLCERVRAEEDAYSENVEEAYEHLLHFLQRHGSDEEFLSDQIVSIVKEFRYARNSEPTRLSIDAIAFCMHLLRWQDVLRAAKYEHDEYFAKRCDTAMDRLIASFDDNWDEASDYRFYR
jgi:hypothetical protein